MSNNSYQILIIDDSPSDRRIYRRFLERANGYSFNILEAETVASGLEHCQKQKLDCIILDFRLPDRDGIQSLPEIHELCDCPIIFITGQAEALLVTEAYRHGVSKYLSKEIINSSVLVEAVIDVLKLE